MKIERSGGRVKIFLYLGYSPETKRGKYKMAGSMCASELVPSPEILTQLSDKQREKLDNYIAQEREKKTAHMDGLRAKFASTELAKLSKCISNGSYIEANETWANEIWHELAGVQKALRKAGFKKPIEVKKTVIKPVDEKQTSLPLPALLPDAPKVEKKPEKPKAKAKAKKKTKA